MSEHLGEGGARLDIDIDIDIDPIGVDHDLSDIDDLSDVDVTDAANPRAATLPPPAWPSSPPDGGFFAPLHPAPPPDAEAQAPPAEGADAGSELSRRVSATLRQRRQRQFWTRVGVLGTIAIVVLGWLNSARPWVTPALPPEVACAHAADHIAPISPALREVTTATAADITSPAGFVAAAMELSPSQQANFNRAMDRAAGEVVHATDPALSAAGRAALDLRGDRGAAAYTQAVGTLVAACFERIGPTAFLNGVNAR